MARQKGEKRMAAFNAKVEKLVNKFGGKKGTFYKWIIPTKAGDLHVNVHEGASTLFSIFCRFEDPKKAVEVLSEYNASNLNKNSGKWNYHMSNENEILRQFEECVKEII